MKPSQMPLKTSPWRRAGRRPAPIIRNEKPRPSRAAKRVALLRSPVRHQAIARAMRPPSSGKPGIRLKTSSSDVDEREPAEHGHRLARAAGVEAERVQRVARAGGQPSRAPTQTTAITSVTAGPAAATRNSSPAERGVALHLGHAAEQPQVDALRCRCRCGCATTAWPSSCSSTLPKNSSAEITAERERGRAVAGEQVLEVARSATR